MIEQVEGWYPPQDVAVPTGADKESVRTLVEAMDANGQIAGALRLAARHEVDYTPPRLAPSKPVDPFGPWWVKDDPWLAEMAEQAKRVCGRCQMALPLTGQCDNCE